MRSILIALLLFSTFFSYTQVKQTIIESKILHFNNEIELEVKSELESLSLPNLKMFIIPDSTRYKKLKFYIKEPNYYRLGRNILYLSPGDSLLAEIDYNNPVKSIFSGSHSIENLYLKNTPFPKAGSYLDAGDALQATTKATIQYILAKADFRQKQLDSIQRYISSTFYDLEKARIKADIINSLLSIPTYYFALNKISKDSMDISKASMLKEVEPFLKSYTTNFINPKYLKIAVYRDVLQTIIKYQSSEFILPNDIAEWYTATELKRKAQKLNERSAFVLLQKDIEGIKNNAYKDALIATINVLSATVLKDLAKDFLVKDSQGKEVKLSYFKNKVIYISLWATWCGPCLEKMPSLVKLQEKFDKNNDVIILSISIDDDEIAWKKFLYKNKLYKSQFIAKRPSLFNYNIASVPRSILIDKEFKIVKLYADDPNSPALESLLQELSNK